MVRQTMTNLCQVITYNGAKCSHVSGNMKPQLVRYYFTVYGPDIEQLRF